jgi:hypothetical protein
MAGWKKCPGYPLDEPVARRRWGDGVCDGSNIGDRQKQGFRSIPEHRPEHNRGLWVIVCDRISRVLKLSAVIGFTPSLLTNKSAGTKLMFHWEGNFLLMPECVVGMV